MDDKACVDAAVRLDKGPAPMESKQAQRITLGPNILQSLNDRKSFSQVAALKVRQFLQMQVVVRLKAALHAMALVGDAQTGHKLQSVS
jgi:hypothetical protein